MIRLSNPFRIFFDYPTNDNTTAIISNVLLPPLLSLSDPAVFLAFLVQIDRPAPKASIIHSTDPLSSPPVPLPLISRVSMGDRETVFARVCCTSVKEEVKRERYAAPARREGRSDRAIPLRTRAPGGEGGERVSLASSEMPLRGFKNTRPTLFAGPPTRADETALSRANREKNSLASSATRIHLSPSSSRCDLLPPPPFSSLLPFSSHLFLVLPSLFFSSKPCLCSCNLRPHEREREREIERIR